MTYSGLPDAGNCVGGISNDRVKVWMGGMAELGMMQSCDEESWRWDLESRFAVLLSRSLIRWSAYFTAVTMLRSDA
jgi:hypothetical protein